MSTGPGSPAPATRPDRSPDFTRGDLLHGVAALITALGRPERDLRAWILLVSGAPGPRVLIDQAEDLRRRLRQTGADARHLCDRARSPVPGGTDHRVAPPSSFVGALAAAATALHAASHAMSPAASALCRQDQLTTTLTTSGMVARRFLATATGATQDAAGMTPTNPQIHHVVPKAGTRRLRQVHAADEEH